MSLIINGTGQDSFNINGIDINNLYVDSVLVWSSEVGEEFTIIHISFGSGTNTVSPPNGWYINTIPNMVNTPTALLGEKGENTDVTLSTIGHDKQTGETTASSGSNSWCISDYQIENRWKLWDDDGERTADIQIYLPAGTWKMKLIGSRDNADIYISDFTFNGITLSQDASFNESCLEWIDIVSTGESFTLEWVNGGGYYGYLNGIDIQETEAGVVKPVITLVGDSTLNYTVGDSYVEYGATATDSVDGDITSDIVIDSSGINMGSVGSYAATYNVANSINVDATEVTRSVTVSAEGEVGTPITGLQPGDSKAVAQANSATLNQAFSTSGQNLVLPENTGSAPQDFNGVTMTGYWATYERILMAEGITLTFEGGLMQIEEAKEDETTLLRIEEENITLNNPLLSQGEYWRTTKPGTHAVLTIYGSNNMGNIVVNGGIIQGGGSNNLQGGRGNSSFNGTVFTRAREHLIYLSGNINGGVSSGMHFNQCTMSYPGIIDEPDPHEANHIQIRLFDNVLMTECEVYGVSQTDLTQMAVVLTDVNGFDAVDCNFSGYRQYFYRTDDRDIEYGNVFNVNFDGGTAEGDTWYQNDASTNKAIRKTYTITDLSTIKNMTLKTPKACQGWTRFENCIFDFETTGVPFECVDLSRLEFHDCTFDLSSATSSVAMTVGSGATTPVFTGTTTRICGSYGGSWGPIPGSC